MKNQYLNAAQIKAELEKCLQCKTKPCMKACPVGCSPYDFIAAAKGGDWQKAANLIRMSNPLGESCGLICPDRFCVKACLRGKIDCPIKIPEVQAYIMRKAREEGEPDLRCGVSNGKKVAVIGSGPAGVGAATELLKQGFEVEVFEQENKVGGALNLIPEPRLPREIIAYEWTGLTKLPNLKLQLNAQVKDYEELLRTGFEYVIAAVGEQQSLSLGVEGENWGVSYLEYLKNPADYATAGNVAIIGGGAVATDCAVTARRQGAKNVEMFVRRRICDMRVSDREYDELWENQVDITTMTRVVKIAKQGELLTAFTVKTRFNEKGKLEDIPQTMTPRADFALIVLALGSNCAEKQVENPRVIYVGDCVNGGSTAVEAIASAQKIVRERVR